MTGLGSDAIYGTRSYPNRTTQPFEGTDVRLAYAHAVKVRGVRKGTEGYDRTQSIRTTYTPYEQSTWAVRRAYISSLLKLFYFIC